MGEVAPLVFGIDVVVPRILEIGLARAPHEACGLVMPDLDKSADEWVHELMNRHHSPDHAYLIDPNTIRTLSADLQRAERRWEDVLVWHTHPRGNIGPSKGDLETRIEGVKYLVVALPRGEATLF